MSTQRTLATTPTQSTPTTGRSDLVVMRVKDPWGENSPWPEPSDPATYDGFPVEIIEGVDKNVRRLQDVPGHQNDTGIALARIDFKPSTGTVNTAMIVDLRNVARPRRETLMRTLALVGSDEQAITAQSGYPAGGQTWPVAAETAWGELFIPEWATRMKIVMTWAGVSSLNNSWGQVWVQVGPTINPHNVKTQAVVWDQQNAAGWARSVIIAADEIPIPAQLRGTTQVFYPRAMRDAASPGGSITKLDYGSAMVLQVEFMEKAD
ncbi:hypothetical protein [Leucobacter luti]|uniref:hypothetical protein n=1 Tax=Leucobacter luti TaxID=340320 RepID=UPI003D03637A